MVENNKLMSEQEQVYQNEKYAKSKYGITEFFIKRTKYGNYIAVGYYKGVYVSQVFHGDINLDFACKTLINNYAFPNKIYDI